MATKLLQISTPVATLILMVPVCVFLFAGKQLQAARRIEQYHHAMTQAAYQRAGAILSQVRNTSTEAPPVQQ